MEKFQFKLKDIISFKNRDFFNKNSINQMNKTFSNPNSKIKELQKSKDLKRNINIKERYSSKAFNRIRSSQNIIKSHKNFFSKNPIRNDLYSSSSIILRAPSVKENRYEIYKMLRKERDKKMNYLNNIYNTLMISESKLYREKLLLSGFKSNYIKGKIELKKKYNMYDINDIYENKRSKKIYSGNNIKSSFILKKKKIADKKYNNTLIRYKHLKKNADDNDNFELTYKNKNKKLISTSTTNKTNYRSNYLKSAKHVEISKSNDVKSLSLSKVSTSRMREQSRPRSKGYKNIYYYELEKRASKIKKKNILFNQDNEKQNSFRIYNDFEMSEMTLALNKFVYNPCKEMNKDIVNIEKIIMKFRTFKEFQIIRLEELSKLDIKGLEKRIIFLQKSLKQYNKISIIFFREIQDYIAFLNDMKLHLSNNLESANNIRFNLYFDIEKLVVDNIIKQRELEHLITIKNFLIQVKHNLIKQPNYFNTILKEISRKYELGRLILELNFHQQNQAVIKFMETIPEIKEEKMNRNILSVTSKLMQRTNTNIIKMSPKKRVKKYSQIYGLKSNNNIPNEKIDQEIIKYMKQPKLVIFKTPNEFMDTLRHLENKNLRLIQENNYIKNNINNLKRKLETLSQYNINEEIEKDIKEKENLLNILKEENNSLSESYNYLINLNNKLSESNRTKRQTKEAKKGFIIDLNALKSLTYTKIIEKYKKKGMFFLEKLLDMVKNFFNLNYEDYGIEKGYELIGKNDLSRIIKLTQKNIKNLGISAINEYTMSLLKLYENICEFVKYKDKYYNSIEKNRNLIYKKKEEIQYERKMNNSKNIRQVEEEKRMQGIKNIMQKDIRINALFSKIFDENIVLKNKIKKNKSLTDMFKYKKLYEEREFNFYVNYE